MPKLKIDGRELEVPQGTNVLEAAERVGITVPHFCYHEALGSVGACRLCAVKFLEGPVKGIQMSCMMEAKDGMVVSTTDPEAVDFRRWIIECLMLNHPLDCPVCDEGGHCFLQDMTVSGGHGIRRYLGLKRTYRDQDLGPFVQHEMNRCIHCFRCRRFYQEYAGYRDLGAMQLGNRTYFGRFESGRLESPFAGNLIDICPTGVYTDRPARFKGRRWDFERAPSVCVHCSLGCNTVGSARFRDLVRVEGNRNDTVNGYFICDRGRFGFAYANRADRPREARMGDREPGWDGGIRVAADALAEVAKREGPAAVACLGSARASLETQAQLLRLAEAQSWRRPRFFLDPGVEARVAEAVGRLTPALAASMADLREADFVVAVGVDPLAEAPVLALALRQAARKGAPVVVIDPRPVTLPLEFERVAAHPRDLAGCLGALVRAGVSGDRTGKAVDRLPGDADTDRATRLAELGERLAASRRPVVVCGTDLVPAGLPALAADCAELLGQDRERSGLFYLLPGPNAFGAGLLSPRGSQAEELLEAIEGGAVKALVLAEADPFFTFPDRQRWEAALERLELVIALDYLASESVARASFVLPTTTVFEAGASHFVNQEGRLQQAAPVHAGGTPISQTGKGSHPPRIFVDRAPGSDPKPAWEVLSQLSHALSRDPLPPGELWGWLGARDPAFRPLSAQGGEPPAGRLLREEKGPAASPAGADNPGEDGLSVLPMELTFGTEELSVRSAPATGGEEEPRVTLHPADAERAGVEAGGRVRLRLPGGELEAPVEVSESMARGALLLPRHRRWEWQKLTLGDVTLSFSDLEAIP